MAFMKYIFCFIFFSFYGIASATPIEIDKEEDYIVLDKFFRIMFTNSDYGFVLDGTKPISQADVASLGYLIAPQNKNFHTDVCAREAIKVWEKLYPQQKNIFLKISKLNSNQSSNPGYELSFINKQKLKNVIESNINLFRYVLGPTIDTEYLVNHIINSKDSLDKVLKKNKVLTGIVLGYGAYNSLMHSRAEEIQNSLAANDLPPFTPQSQLMDKKGLSLVHGMRLKALFLSLVGTDASEEKIGSMNPGVGFTDLNEELDSIMANMEKFQSPLKSENPRFIFGAYKSPENKDLIAALENSQKHIQTLLYRPDFLEHVLEKITGEKPILKYTPSAINLLKTQEHPEKAIAYSLRNMCSQLDSETISEFIKAFGNDDKEVHKGGLAVLPNALSGLKQAKSNLQSSESWFATVSKAKNLERITPELYFERVKEGKGKAIDLDDRVFVSYVIEDNFQHVLSAEFKGWIELSKTIPGFAHGVQGMLEGETRHIYIHPALAYGVMTRLPPCTGLLAKVTVHQIPQQPKKALASIKVEDLSWVKDPEIYHEIENAEMTLAKNMGILWRRWLSQSPDINIQKVISYLDQLSNSGNQDHSTVTEKSDEMENICNKVFWNIISASQAK